MMGLSPLLRESGRVTRLVVVVHWWVRVSVVLTLRSTVSGLARTLGMVMCMGCDRSRKVDFLLLVSYGDYNRYIEW